MPTPAKPFTVLKAEKKSHRTKKEMQQREKEEKALLSGKSFTERNEVANHPVAHQEFLRVKELLEGIEKNDALYEPIINRYCEMQAECSDLKEQRQDYMALLGQIKTTFDSFSNAIDEYTRGKLVIELANSMAKITTSIDKIDSKIQQKRKMLFDIEKENVFTIASGLRSIPKKMENKKSELMKALGGD